MRLRECVTPLKTPCCQSEPLSNLADAKKTSASKLDAPSAQDWIPEASNEAGGGDEIDPESVPFDTSNAMALMGAPLAASTGAAHNTEAYPSTYDTTPYPSAYDTTSTTLAQSAVEEEEAAQQPPSPTMFKKATALSMPTTPGRTSPEHAASGYAQHKNIMPSLNKPVVIKAAMPTQQSGFGPRPSGFAQPAASSRNVKYPGTSVSAAPVQNMMWSAVDATYKPTNYTAESVLAKSTWSDPPHSVIRGIFNQQDGLIDRVSKVAPYAIVDGLPRNPMGRTGFAGRGALGRWGVNHQTHVAITR